MECVAAALECEKVLCDRIDIRENMNKGILIEFEICSKSLSGTGTD